MSQKPQPFDLTKRSEKVRLMREVHGYLKTSFHHGTDQEGRAHALNALKMYEEILETEPEELDVEGKYLILRTPDGRYNKGAVEFMQMAGAACCIVAPPDFPSPEAITEEQFKTAIRECQKNTSR